jgi:mannose-6-phosphate isomerase
MRSPFCSPLLCEPLLIPKIWGGRRLETVLGKCLPPRERIGESWEVADLPDAASAVTNGPLPGASLRELMLQYGFALAPAAEDGRFPLLVKFIDAEDDLSVQLHPDREACAQHFPEHRPKHEYWIVVDSPPGGCIVHGVRADVARSELASRIGDGELLECVRRIPVQPGDVIDVPPGTLHALSQGMMVLEIQEPSDATFRVYDYGRLGEDGQPRPLHIEEALQAATLRNDVPAKLTPRRETFGWGHYELLVDIAPFRIERLRLRRAAAWHAAPDVPTVLVVLGGGVQISGGAESTALRLGQSCILPPVLERVELHSERDAQVILAAPVTGRDESGSPRPCVQGL